MTAEEFGALVEHQVRAWEAEDVPAILYDFVDDGALVTPLGAFAGRTAIEAAIRGHYRDFAQTRITPLKWLVSGDAAAIEWVFAATHRATGARCQTTDGILVDLRGDKIASFREYWDVETYLQPIRERLGPLSAMDILAGTD